MDRFFSILADFRSKTLPGRLLERLNTPRGLLWGFVVVHLGFLIFAALLSFRNEAFSDTFIYREWALAG
ncbi:hypothetical protein AB4Y88_01440, partial [Paenarthrobacter sp. RAF9]